MRILKIATLLCAFVCVIPAETMERQLHIVNSPSPQDMQEMATVFRTVFDIAELSIDSPSANITVHGTPAQIAGVEWFVHDVSEPADIRARAPHEYREQSDRFPIVRAFYLDPAASERYVQELLTVLRTVVDVQKVFNLSHPRVIVMRASEPDVQTCAWIIDELGRNAKRPDEYSGIHQFRPSAGKPDIVRIFYPQYSDRPEFATILKPLRSQLKIQRAFLVTTPEALVVRGTSDEIASAEKMIGVR